MKLGLVGETSLLPPEAAIDLAQQAQMEKELEEAAQVPVPAGDDDF
jgi:hypothetical protein